MDLPVIIRSAVEALIAATIQGVAAVTTEAVEARSAADDRGRGLSLIRRAHLRHIYGVAGDDDVPSIWREMSIARMKAEVLALISQLFLTGMSACQSKSHGPADPLHISLFLFKFVAWSAFTNHGNHLAFPSGGISPQTSLQCMGDRGEALESTLADIGAQDSHLANADSLARGAKLTLSVIVGADNLRRELGTFSATFSQTSLATHALMCVRSR